MLATEMTSAESGPEAGTIVVRQLEGGHSRATQTKLLAFWLDNPWCDWVGCVALGALTRYVFLPMIHLGTIVPGIRFSVYAAVAAGALAVAAIAFTPLAILTALGAGRDRDHLLLYDRDIRRNFLRATLILLLCALVLIGCGAADTSQQANAAAENIAALALSLAVMKTLRLTALFAAILSASANDELRERRQRPHTPAA